MSDRNGGGESGGGTGPDAEVENEPAQQSPSLPADDSLEVGPTSREGSSPAAKRPKITDEESDLGQCAVPHKMHEETPGHPDLQQEDSASAQSRVPESLTGIMMMLA